MQTDLSSYDPEMSSSPLRQSDVTYFVCPGKTCTLCDWSSAQYDIGAVSQRAAYPAEVPVTLASEKLPIQLFPVSSVCKTRRDLPFEAFHSLPLTQGGMPQLAV